MAALTNNLKKTGWVFIVLLIIMVTWGIGIGLADEKEQILSIKLVPELKSEKTGLPDSPMPDLNGVGRIDRIKSGRIVINDRSMRLAPGVVYRSLKGLVEKSQFHQGATVGYQLDENRKIIALWLLED